MKRLFSLFVIILTLEAQAQSYRSLFGQNSTWWIIEWGNLDITARDTIYVQKDTIVNGLMWKKLFCNNGVYTGGLLREDTLLGKVWYKTLDNIDTSTKIAFDFSLQKGDTFDIHDVWGNPPSSLKIVDTTYIENGRKKIVFKYWHTKYQAYTTFIEGIGCNFGIIYKQYIGFMQSHYLLCSYKDGVKTYSNVYYNGDCNPVISSISEPNDFELNIYPNPFQDYLKIDVYNDSFFETVQLINGVGQIVYSIPFRNFLVIKNLSKGVYYLRLINKKGNHYQKTIAKL